MRRDWDIEEVVRLCLTHWERFIAGILLAGLLVSAVIGSSYRVDKTQEATVERFGAYVKTVGPGFKWKLPFIDHIHKTDVTTVQRLEIGFVTTSIDQSGAKYDTVPEEAEMLTGDDNIALVDFVVQYRSADARKWQYTVQDPEKMLRLMAEAAMRKVVGESPFDEVATSGKVKLQAKALGVLQGYVDTLDFGAQIVNLQLQDVSPPGPVEDSFKDVVNAREDKETSIQKARKYANSVVPEARGNAKKIINDAEGYAKSRVAEAHGDAARFTALLAKYNQAPGVTAQRLMFETQERVLQGKNVTVIPGNDSALLKLLQLNNQPAAQAK